MDSSKNGFGGEGVKRILLRIFVLTAVLCLQLLSVNVLAESSPFSLVYLGRKAGHENIKAAGVQIRTEGIIVNHYLDVCQKEFGANSGAARPTTIQAPWLIVDCGFSTNRSVSEIGFTKIVIDQMDSSGNIKTLYEVKDYYSLDTSVCDFTREFYAPVGYRYKVSVVRYAKEDGWFFPISQSIHDYSKWIYISP